MYSKYTIMLAIAMISLTGCSDLPDNDTETSKLVIMDDSLNQYNAENVNDINNSVEDVEIKSIIDLFKYTDPKWNQEDDYLTAVEGYNSGYEAILADGKKRHSESFEPHFAVAYINNDDIPELLVSYGTTHFDGICVYTYDLDDNKVEYVGEFSTYGQFAYNEKKNIMNSTYGNHGFFLSIFSTIKDGKVNLNGAIISDESGHNGLDVKHYYYGFPVPDWMDGRRESFEIYGNGDETFDVYMSLSDDYLISYEDYNKNFETLMGGSSDEIINVNYDNSVKIDYP